MAACNGWLDVMTELLKHKPNINAKDVDGNTPLHLAVFFQQYKVRAAGGAGAGY